MSDKPEEKRSEPEKAGLPARQGETRAVAPISESMATAAAAGAKAAIEAQYLMALKNPRDVDLVRLKLNKAAQRPRFAEVAEYAKPIGNSKVRGPSIRFAEEAARAWGNNITVVQVIYEDDERRVMAVQTIDLESNLGYKNEIVIEKTVERKTVREGQEVIRTRLNTKQEKVYIIAATEDDLLTKQNAHVSKATRTNILRIIPGDITEEAMDVAKATRERDDAKDPDAAKRKVLDGFFTLAAITPAQIAEYLGHPVEQVTPAELEDLRAVFVSLREGDSSWSEVMAQRAAVRGGTAQPPAGAPGAKPTGKDAVQQAVGKKPEPPKDRPREPGED